MTETTSTDAETDTRRICRECGCTDNNACLDMLDEPCWWASPDLCSACR